MALKNLFDMVKADRYTADGREALIKAQEAETEDATRRTYQIGEISQATGLQKTANGWVKPKSGAGRNHGTEQKKLGPGAIHTPGKGSVGIDKMKEAAEKGLKGQELKEFMTGSKSENKTTIRQGPKTKTLNETPAEHVQKNLDAYKGYQPYDMEELVLKPSGYEKQTSAKVPGGGQSITYTKNGAEDITLFFDKNGELENADVAESKSAAQAVQNKQKDEIWKDMKKREDALRAKGMTSRHFMDDPEYAHLSELYKNEMENDSAPSLSEIVDRVYNIGEISEKTGLQKTAQGWKPPKETKFGKVKQNKEGQWGVQTKQGKGSDFLKHKSEKEASRALANYTAGYNTTERSKQDPHSDQARQVKHWDKETEKIRKQNRAEGRAAHAAQFQKPAAQEEIGKFYTKFEDVQSAYDAGRQTYPEGGYTIFETPQGYKVVDDPKISQRMEAAGYRKEAEVPEGTKPPKGPGENIGINEKENKIRQVLNTALTPSGDKVQMTKSKVTGDFHVLLNGKSTGGGFRDPQKAKEEFNAWIAGKKAPSESAKERINKRFDESEARSQKAMEAAGRDFRSELEKNPKGAYDFEKTVEKSIPLSAGDKEVLGNVKSFMREEGTDYKDALKSVATGLVNGNKLHGDWYPEKEKSLLKIAKAVGMDEEVKSYVKTMAKGYDFGYSEDAAPRVLTGDTRIRVRK